MEPDSAAVLGFLADDFDFLFDFLSPASLSFLSFLSFLSLLGAGVVFSGLMFLRRAMDWDFQGPSMRPTGADLDQEIHGPLTMGQ